MPKVALYNQTGSQVGEIELSDAVFGIKPNEALLHQAVLLQQAAERQGTHAVKNRAAVRGGGRKPWRQKGTGRARQGSIRSPQWVGGGVVFGPTPRKYGFKMPKKMRRLALKSALSSKALSDELVVLEGLNLEQPKTSLMAQVLKGLQADRKALVVSEQFDEKVALSARNIPGVKYMTVNGLNVLDIIRFDKLIITKDAVTRVEEVLG
ncbi:50S ribosomal protein L4 [Rubeoparvulum massiliense]|uniref:50S ribosomal protein L4 n=1 Tax=Rubeoparvulum massiliense TaxID=1631346 RepID=UPI00065E2958|nr:50S ribosomal protein L4 [Rubeoparvulum massiliense]